MILIYDRWLILILKYNNLDYNQLIACKEHLTGTADLDIIGWNTKSERRKDTTLHEMALQNQYQWTHFTYVFQYFTG